MIKFFRKIRQNLLSEGKTGKYFKYAIGEIILVVIGILLALQINTWNQQRIEDKKETELISALIDEFKDNLIALEESISINNKVTESCINLTQIIRSDSLAKKHEQVDELLLAIGNFHSFDARVGISNEIVNSGKLSLLKNEALRVQLSDWLKNISDDEEDFRFRADNYTINLMPFLMKRFPLANGELTKKLPFDRNNSLKVYKEASPFKFNLSRTDLMELENQVWHHKHNNDYIVINEGNLKEFILATIDMLEQELKKG
ncbi:MULTISPECIES: DUF6090 family protein [Croceitalea]|uniref:DUF6090 family protein n=1 Tax=Croceitalea vernalis TaxID=3075599 RepID=A0ABU3BEB1_9FLAO|nr:MULTISPECIES: DUF6090 family protein [unclassified Croceitalea]MDT0538703.1 DUF6090 family protein [Croceitalea sp. P059]MDT0620487.1 DUF6090 family protein [Croceitalea sp. P007]